MVVVVVAVLVVVVVVVVVLVIVVAAAVAVVVVVVVETIKLAATRGCQGVTTLAVLRLGMNVAIVRLELNLGS